MLSRCNVVGRDQFRQGRCCPRYLRHKRQEASLRPNESAVSIHYRKVLTQLTLRKSFLFVASHRKGFDALDNSDTAFEQSLSLVW